MVDIQETQKQLQEQRQAIIQAQQQARAQQLQLTQEQLRTGTRLSRRIQTQEFQQKKEQTLKLLKKELEQTSTAQIQLGAYKEEQQRTQAYNQAISLINQQLKSGDYASKPKGYESLSSEGKKMFDKAMSEASSRQAGIETRQQKYIKEQEKKPVLVLGEQTLKDIEARLEKGDELLSEKLAGRKYQVYQPEISIKSLIKAPVLTPAQTSFLTPPSFIKTDWIKSKIDTSKKGFYPKPTLTQTQSRFLTPTTDTSLIESRYKRAPSYDFVKKGYKEIKQTEQEGELRRQERAMQEYIEQRQPIINKTTGEYRYETQQEYGMRKYGEANFFQKLVTPSSVGLWFKRGYQESKEFITGKEQEKIKTPITDYPILEQKVISLVDAIIKFYAFSPYMTTGTAQQRQLTEREKLEIYKKLLKEKDKTINLQQLEKLNRLSNKINVLAQQGKTKEIEKILNQILNDISKIENPEQKIKSAQGFVEYLRNLQASGIIPYESQQNLMEISLSRIPTLSPSDVSIAGTTASLFAPKEKDKPEENIFIKKKVTDIEAPTGKIKPFEDVGKIEFLGEIGKGKTGIKEALATGLLSGLTTKQATQQVELLRQTGKLKEGLAQKPALLSMTALLQKQRLKQQYQQQQLLKQKLKQPQPTKPTFKITYFPTDLSTALSKVKKIAKEKPEVFEVFGKRFGKDIKLFETTEKEKAEKGLRFFLEKTLGRSGFITRKGERIATELFKSPKYRRAKKEPFRVVQKAKFSLGTPSEIKEIQYFKKKASKGKTRKKSFKINWFS